MSKRLGSLIFLLGIAVLAVGCGDTGEAGTAKTTPAAERSKMDRPQEDRPRILARDAQLRDESTATLLRMPSGDLRTTCIGGHVKTIFRSDGDRGADIVVQSGAKSRSGNVNHFQGNRNLGDTFTSRLYMPGIQTWSIAEIAKAEVRPTVITVAAKRSAGYFRCAVSALATIGNPNGTITK